MCVVTRETFQVFIQVEITFQYISPLRGVLGHDLCAASQKENTHGSGINVIQYSPEVKRKMSSSGALNHSCAISYYSLTLTASFISRCLQSFLLTISSQETVGDYSLTAVLWGKQLSSSFSTLHTMV